MISIVQEMLDELDEMEFSKIKTYESNKELFEQKALYLKRCQDDLAQEEYDRFARDFIAYIDTTKRFPSTVNKKVLRISKRVPKHGKRDHRKLI